MKKAVSIVLSGLLLAGCSTAPEAPRPGNPEVYEKIAAQTECGPLNGMFLSYSESIKRYEANGDGQKAGEMREYRSEVMKREQAMNCS